MKKLFLLSTWFVMSQSVFAQLTVDGSKTDLQLAQLLTASGVTISNLSVDCQTTRSGKGYGSYNALNTSLGLTDGLLLTNGSIANALGPNNKSSITSFFTAATNTPNTSTNPIKTLVESQLSVGRVMEFCEFSFDVVPMGDTLKMDYVFASEEYDEYVGEVYNDVFAFFISGPDPAGGNFTDKNIALLPGTTTPVAINNVNNGQVWSTAPATGPCMNCQYYQNNSGSTTVQYDGYVKKLKAVSAVKPCKTYRLKLVVADIGDRSVDSGVFIEKITSTPDVNISFATPGGTPFAIEGCNPATVTFTRRMASPSALTVPYFISGTAVNGTDYPAIGSTDNASPKFVTIPGSQTSASYVLNAYADRIAESEETVNFALSNPECPSGVGMVYTLGIRDSIFPSLTPAAPVICSGKSVVLTGTAPKETTFAWSPSTGLNAVTGSPVTASPTATTTYTMTAKVGACTETRQTRVTVNPLPDTKSLSPGGIPCFGGTSVLTMPASQSGISYQLTRQPAGTAEGAAQTGNGNTLTFNTGTLTGPTSFTVKAVNPASTCSGDVSAPVLINAPALPKRVASDRDQNTCPVSGNSWLTFIHPATDRVIVSVNPNGNDLGNVTATGYVDGSPIDVQACNAPQPQFSTAVMNRRWTIKPERQPASPVDVRLYFTQAEYDALKIRAGQNLNLNDEVTSLAALVLSKYSGLNENGTFSDNCGNGTTARFNSSGNGNITGLFTGFDVNGRYLQFSIRSFSEFWLHGSSTVSPLPIELGEFKTSCVEEGVLVDWTTVSEINNAYFTVYRSADAVDWESLTVLAGAGNSNQERNYTFTDLRPLPGTSYYRLRQTDYDGATELFDPVSTQCGAGAGKPEIRIYPNPADEQFTLTVYAPETDPDARVYITDVTGKRVFVQNLPLQSGENTLTVNRMGLGSGTYFVHLAASSAEFTVQKVVLR